MKRRPGYAPGFPVAGGTYAKAARGWFNWPQGGRIPDTIEVAWQCPNFAADYSLRPGLPGAYFSGDEPR